MVLLWLIYDLNIIPNSDFDTNFLPIILFLKIFVAEKVAKSSAEWCRVVVCFVAFLVNDIYGYINWQKNENQAERKQIVVFLSQKSGSEELSSEPFAVFSLFLMTMLAPLVHPLFCLSKTV